MLRFERRVCPVCAARLDGIVQSDCSMCGGVGLVQLGRRARETPPVEVGRAIGVYVRDAMHKNKPMAQCARYLVEQGYFVPLGASGSVTIFRETESP